jgi:enhancing lycopene biosynthesis protein 2
MPLVGVVLSGCGVFDGAEIHESVITLLALDRRGAKYQCIAPDTNQLHVVNHLTGEVAADETRNVLVEAARIARGEIKNLADVKATDFDAIIFPGGYGAAKNLCNFAVKGADCDVHPEVQRFVLEALEAKIPLGILCIAPVLLARIAPGVKLRPNLTIGTDEDTASAIVTMGACHVACPVNEFVVDEENRIVTTPAYMLAQRISEAAEGIEKLIDRVLELAELGH